MAVALADSMEKLGTHTFDDVEATMRTVDDMKAIVDGIVAEYLGVIVESIASLKQPEAVDA